jgi:transposase
MVRLQDEQNLETLRQISILLDNENKRLTERIQKLTLEIARLHGFDDKQRAQLELSLLQELEKVRENLFLLDKNKSEGVDANEAKKKNPPKGHGPRAQPNLPCIELPPFELADDDKDCKVCGLRVDEMAGQFEESEIVTVVHREFRVERVRQQKYRCRCNANVVTAPGPEKLIPGGRYSVEFAVEVAVGKYADHLPLERQVRIMGREGLEIDSQTLWDQVNAVAKHVEPTYEALVQRALESPVLHADESGWPILGKKKKKSPGSVWNLSTPEVAVYRMMPSKSEEDGRKVLGSYQGTVIADGYIIYENLKRDGPYRLANCWAHVKRHADDISENFPVACEELLGFIRKLYDVEREVPGKFPGNEDAQTLRHRLRQERSRELTDDIHDWLFAQHGLPRSEFGKLVRYILERWEGLTVFLDDPLVPLDNNAAERALRGPVLGRKNHYGSRSQRGAKVAGILYSLCETAKLHGLDPRAYLLTAVRAAIHEPGAITMPEDLLNDVAS